MVSRVDRGPVANWWWTIDRYFLAACLALMGLGVLLSFAASPAVAQRIGLDSFHFVERQTIFMIPAVGVMIGVSFLSPRQIRRFALILLCASLFLMAAALSSASRSRAPGAGSASLAFPFSRPSS